MAAALRATLLAAAITAAEDAFVTAAANEHDAGAAEGYAEIRTGVAPAIGAAPTGTLLVTCTFSDPSHTVTPGSSTASASGSPTGTAVAAEADIDTTGAWFRSFDSNGATVAQGDVAFTDAGEEMILDTNTIGIGQTVTITTFDIVSSIT